MSNLSNNKRYIITNSTSPANRKSLSTILQIRSNETLKIDNKMQLHIEDFNNLKNLENTPVNTNKSKTSKNQTQIKSKLKTITSRYDNFTLAQNPQSIDQILDIKISKLGSPKSIKESLSYSETKSKTENSALVANATRENLTDYDFYKALKNQKRELLNSKSMTKKVNTLESDTPTNYQSLAQYFANNQNIVNLTRSSSKIEKSPGTRQSLFRITSSSKLNNKGDSTTKNRLKSSISKHDNSKIKGKNDEKYSSNPHEENKKKDENDEENDEIIMISKISKNVFNEFKKKIDLYNKYYSNYIFEPQQRFTSPKDLNVKIEPKIPGIFPKRQHQSSISSKMDTNRIAPSKIKISYTDTDQNNESNITNISSINTITSKYHKAQQHLLHQVEQNKWNNLIKAMEGSKAKTHHEEGELISIHQDLKKIEMMNAQLTQPTNLTEEETNFFKLIKAGSLEDIKLTLLKNPDLAKIKDLMYETPLHWAAKRGFNDIVYVLLKYKADIYATDIANRTAKDIAIMKDHKKIILQIEEEKLKENQQMSIKKDK